MSTTAITALHSAFSDSFESLGQDSERDRNTVVVSWPSVPVEVIRAAGLNAVFATSSARETPDADQVLEAGVFPNRIRQLLQAALSGRLAQVAAIVLPRTSDADYKAYLYLTELRRRGRFDALPPLLLFDLLQSQSTGTADYNRARVSELLASLARIGGRPATADALRAQIAGSNAARAAAWRLAALRTNPARVAGSELLPLLGARWILPPERYVALADRALETLARRAPRTAAAHVLLAGTPVDSAALHATIESLQAMVVDEISPYGSDDAAGNIDAAGDPFTALADWYGTQLVTARVPPASLLRRCENSLAGIDAVVILLPPDDARFGWEYPRLRALLNSRGIGHAVVGSDPELALPEKHRERLRVALAAASTMQAVGHG